MKNAHANNREPGNAHSESKAGKIASRKRAAKKRADGKYAGLTGVKTDTMKKPIYLNLNRPILKTKNRMRHIVVHCTGTFQNILIDKVDVMPYNILITPNGRVLAIKPEGQMDKTFEVALLGGLDEAGRHVDGRTEAQNIMLLSLLTVLTNRFPKATIVGADELYPYGFANPGFTVKEWLASYTPPFLKGI